MLLNSNGGPKVTTTTRGLRWRLMFFLIGPITFVMSLDRTAIVVAAPTIQREFGFTLVQMSASCHAGCTDRAGLGPDAGSNRRDERASRSAGELAEALADDPDAFHG